jgi:hypothetical protein
MPVNPDTTTNMKHDITTLLGLIILTLAFCWCVNQSLKCVVATEAIRAGIKLNHK